MTEEINANENSKKLLHILGIKYPILQGGMAWVANASLAAAVSNAGGLGIIAAGNAPASVVKEEIEKAKKMTDKPFGVNVMLLSPFVDDVVDVILSQDIKVVTTGAGSPAKYMEAFKSKGIKVIPVVASVALARRMEKMGADAIIAEGMEAGGHIGKLTTMALIPQIVDAVSIPVVAAGGIADGRGFAAALMLGASGGQIGTRFLAAYECTAHQNYKQAVFKAKDIDTVITGEITGHPIRVLRNRLSKNFLTAEKEEAKKEVPNIERLEELGAGTLKKAVIDGDIIEGSIMAGQVSGLVNKEQSCQEIIEEIISQVKTLLPYLNI